MKTALIYNPRSGRRNGRRAALISAIADVLRTSGEVLVLPTTCAGDATNQARIAIGEGCGRIISAGGDGTAHEILQALVESRSQAALGILPLGTGNVLAKDIGIPLDPIAAARTLLTFEPRRLFAGRIECLDRRSDRPVSRYFTVAAGVGGHARLIYSANAQAKGRGGQAAYYYTGFHSLFTHKFAKMETRITSPEGRVTSREVVEVVAMRVSSFGGLLRNWRPGGALRSNELRLVLLTHANRAALFRYALAAFAGRTREAAGIEFASAIRVECTAVEKNGPPIHSQADGEVLGTTPITLSIVPDAFTLLVPPDKAH